MPFKIIAGPLEFCCERNGVRSETVILNESHGPEDIRRMAARLIAELNRFLAPRIYWRHRLRMTFQRQLAAILIGDGSRQFYPGTSPQHIARKPWKVAARDEWALLPAGVVSRVLRTQKENTYD